MQADDSHLTPEELRLLAQAEIICQKRRLKLLCEERQEAIRRLDRAQRILEAVKDGRN